MTYNSDLDGMITSTCGRYIINPMFELCRQGTTSAVWRMIMDMAVRASVFGVSNIENEVKRFMQEKTNGI